jgi:hypothetical protein
MCGVLADGDKVEGFKSMVIAQFTGIGLQKDDNAFVVYNSSSSQYDDNTVAGNETISNNSRAVFKPAYRNFHIKAVNDAFIQNVSIFAIGYAEHFAVESGGDFSVTNSNSNFGAKALIASGFRRNAFPQDDLGYITHIIPPKELTKTEKKNLKERGDANKDFLEKQKALLKTEREKIMLERSRLYYQWKEIQETDESIQKDQERVSKMRGDLQFELEKIHNEYTTETEKEIAKIRKEKNDELELQLTKDRKRLDRIRMELHEIIAIETANLENMKKDKIA